MKRANHRHPRALYVLTVTEVWERFGYYLMLALFVLYLNEKVKLSVADATSLYGTYTGLVYLTPLLGGMVADRILGHRRAVLLGALLMSIGYFVLALEQLYAALAFIILGNGLFKPNISALVGGLYPPGDRRRDSAFGIFYLGVNVGAFFAPLAAGLLRQRYGWSAAFATAGAGMFIGLVLFALAGRTLGARPAQVAAPTAPAPTAEEEPTSKVVRERVRALLVMCAIATFFWVCFQQNGSTLILWARDNTDLTLGGLVQGGLDPAMFGSVNAFFIIVLTPLLLVLFRQLRERGREPSTPAKLGLGMLLVGLSCAVMAAASLCGGDHGRVSALWLVGSYFVVTVGELCLSPVGLSMVTKLAPRRAVALMLGFWYLATAIGNKMAGNVGRFWEVWPHSTFFAMLTLGSLGAAAALALNLKRLRAAMPGEHQVGGAP